MKYIALLGAKGFVGSGIYKELIKKKTWRIEAVTRDNYSEKIKHEYDIVINSAMPSARFWAKNHPQEDFIETVQKTADIIYGWKYKKLVQISTMSARTERTTVYGRHKAAAEALCDHDRDLIIRLSAMFTDTLSKGALIDILNNRKVYVDKKSRYAFASLEFVSEWIVNNLDKKGIWEIGARNTLSLEQIVKHIHIPTEFDGRIDIQRIAKPSKEFPDAKEVLKFMKRKIQEKKERI